MLLTVILPLVILLMIFYGYWDRMKPKQKAIYGGLIALYSMLLTAFMVFTGKLTIPDTIIPWIILPIPLVTVVIILFGSKLSKPIHMVAGIFLASYTASLLAITAFNHGLVIINPRLLPVVLPWIAMTIITLIRWEKLKTAQKLF